MKTIIRFTSVLVLLATMAAAQQAEQKGKSAESPLARIADRWVEAVNSRDQAKYAGFVREHFSAELLGQRTPEAVAESHMNFHREVVGPVIKLVKTLETSEERLRVLFEDQAGRRAIANFEASQKERGKLSKIGVQPPDEGGGNTPQAAVPSPRASSWL